MAPPTGGLRPALTALAGHAQRFRGSFWPWKAVIRARITTKKAHETGSERAPVGQGPPPARGGRGAKHPGRERPTQRVAYACRWGRGPHRPAVGVVRSTRVVSGQRNGSRT